MKLKIGQLVMAELVHNNIYHPQQFLGRIKKVYGTICDIEDLTKQKNIFRVKRDNITPEAIRIHRVS